MLRQLTYGIHTTSLKIVFVPNLIMVDIGLRKYWIELLSSRFVTVTHSAGVKDSSWYNLFRLYSCPYSFLSMTPVNRNGLIKIKVQYFHVRGCVSLLSSFSVCLIDRRVSKYRFLGYISLGLSPVLGFRAIPGSQCLYYTVTCFQ